MTIILYCITCETVVCKNFAKHEDHHCTIRNVAAEGNGEKA